MINEPKYLGGLEIGLSTNLLQMLTNDMKMISDVQNIASKDHSKNKTALINLAVTLDLNIFIGQKQSSHRSM